MKAIPQACHRKVKRKHFAQQKNKSFDLDLGFIMHKIDGALHTMLI